MPVKLIYTFIFLPIIICIGVFTIREDFLNSRIRNKWIIVGLIYAGVVYCVFGVIYLLAQGGFLQDQLIARNTLLLTRNFDKWCVNLAVSAIVAYFLWHFKMWGAGDAKLFIAYAALIPMGQYSKAYFNYYFASFLLLLAIFIPATAFFLLKAAVYFLKQFNFQVIKMWPKLLIDKFTKLNKPEAAKVLLGFIALFLFFRILQRELSAAIARILPDQNLLALFSLMAFRQLSGFFRKNTKFLIIAASALIIYFVFWAAESPQTVAWEAGNIFARISLITLMFPAARKISDLYSERTLKKTTPFAHWMFIGVLIVWFMR